MPSSCDKRVVSEIAKECLTDWRAVEHGIRIAIVRSWDEDPQRFQDILTVKMKYRPSSGKFLAFLYSYLVLTKEEKLMKVKKEFLKYVKRFYELYLL